MPTDELTPILAATWFARDLSPRAREHLAALGTLIDFPEGTTIIREGDVCRSIGVVVSGRVALRLRLPGGEDRTILTVEPGDVFGWSAVLPPAVATASAVAIVPTRAVMFDGERPAGRLRDRHGTRRGRLQPAAGRASSAVSVRPGRQLLDLYRAGGEPW